MGPIRELAPEQLRTASATDVRAINEEVNKSNKKQCRRKKKANVLCTTVSFGARLIVFTLSMDGLSVTGLQGSVSTDSVERVSCVITSLQCVE